MGDLIVEDPVVDKLIVEDPIVEEEFVWPWMRIVANIKTEQKSRSFVGERGSKLITEFSKKGFNPARVHPLWDFHGHSGFAVVEFETNWKGFHSAMLFEQSFKNEGCGKEDFDGMRCPPGEKLYGWVARADDYTGGISVVSKYLQRNGDLKMVSGLEAEEKGKLLRLVSNLNETLEIKSSELNEMVESKCDETKAPLEVVMRETDEKKNEVNAERGHERGSQQQEPEKNMLEEQQSRALNDSEKRENLP